MTQLNNKIFIEGRKGVRVLHDASARQFIHSNSFDYNCILGLDKPKKRVKALTGIHAPLNCKVGKKYMRPFGHSHQPKKQN